MEFQFKKSLGFFGLVLGLGLVFDAAVLSSDAEACLFGGKKCREKKARRLTAKSEAACSQDPNSKKCLRVTNRLEKVLGRKNMGGFRKKMGLDSSQVSLAHQMQMKRFCEMRGIKDKNQCQAAYNNRSLAGTNSGAGSTSNHGSVTAVSTGPQNAVRY